MTTEPIMTLADLDRFIETHFREIIGFMEVEAIGPMTARFSLLTEEHHLRPGGTVSGPTLFALADCGFYLTLMAMIGPKGLAVTTSASIDFMRKPDPARKIIAETRILKLGRALAVGDAFIRHDDSDDVLARASFTYSIPPQRAT